jgi:hypothetical protein
MAQPVLSQTTDRYSSYGSERATMQIAAGAPAADSPVWASEASADTEL